MNVYSRCLQQLKLLGKEGGVTIITQNDKNKKQPVSLKWREVEEERASSL